MAVMTSAGSGSSISSFGETGTGVRRPPSSRTSRWRAWATAFHAVFIRAPVVESVGAGVDVLATLPPASRTTDFPVPAGTDAPVHGRQAVVCRQDAVLTTSFHPELTGDLRLHQLFVTMAKERL